MKFAYKIRRTVYIVLSIAIGSGIVWGLSLAGEKSKGPIQNLLDHTSEVVQDIEQKVVLETREIKRSDKLQWYQPYQKSMEKLRHPNSILMGASDDHGKDTYKPIIDLEDSLNTTFPLIHIYAAWGSKASEKFPKIEAKSIIELGSTPIITWEPWLSDFDETEFPGIPKIEDRDKGSMAAIAAGTYDSYISNWANDARKIGKPIFVRFGHEMNDPYRYPWGPQNNTPKEYVAAWQHVHDVFKKAGANNVLWIWSPHLSYGYFDAFYPGKDYVDYVGVGVLNYGTAATWSKWWTFKEIFGTYYHQLDSLKKPIMLSEFGSLNVGGNRAKWFNDALAQLPAKYPSIKSIVFFHYSSDKTITDKAISWYIKDDIESRKVITKYINSWKKE